MRLRCRANGWHEATAPNRRTMYLVCDVADRDSKAIPCDIVFQSAFMSRGLVLNRLAMVRVGIVVNDITPFLKHCVTCVAQLWSNCLDVWYGQQWSDQLSDSVGPSLLVVFIH